MRSLLRNYLFPTVVPLIFWTTGIAQTLSERAQEKMRITELRNQTEEEDPTEVFPLPLTLPESDCPNAIVVCQQTYTYNQSPPNFGHVQELGNNTCLLNREQKTTWYIFTVQTSGTFGFYIDTRFDYDFALFDYDAIGGCAGTRTATPIRCNYSADYGRTGLDANNPRPGSIQWDASQPPIMPGLNVQAGQTFLLVVDNWTRDETGYTITFTGTAQIFDQTPPTIRQVSCTGNPNQLLITFSEIVRCNSIHPSDFQLSGGATVTQVSAPGCGQYTDRVILTFDGALPSGNHTLTIRQGTDGNTIVDKCGNPISPGTTANFGYLAPVTLTADPPAVCAGNSTILTASTSGGFPPGTTFSWNTGATTPSITVQPTTTTTYTFTASLGGCSRTANITVNLQPNPTISVSPTNAVICGGTASIVGTASIPGGQWEVSSDGGANWANTDNPMNLPPGNYLVRYRLENCLSNTVSVSVTTAPPADANTCDVVYVTPTGNPAAPGTKAAPTDLATALQRAACSRTVIKLAIGTYELNAPITTITNNITLEGGFDPANDWRKTSQAGATRLLRRAVNVEGCEENAPRLVALQISNASGFRLQDLTVEVEDAPPPSAACASGRGVSTYALHLNNCRDYTIVRCRFIAGRGGDGLAGSPGAPGRNAADHQTPPQCGGPGHQDDCDERDNWGGAGATVPWGANGGSGGRGGHTANGQAGGASPCGGSIPCTGGSGGGGGASCGFGIFCDCDDEDNHGRPGEDGGSGAPGAPGALGPAGTMGVWWVPGSQGGTGTQGQHGRGGGGGGGGGGQTHFVCWPLELEGTGAGGGGGGAGGEGGQGGTGGWGGGSAFCAYLFANSGGAFIDCEFNTPVAGNGGAGGPGGPGGQGSLGAGRGGGGHTTCPRHGCDIGFGGPGGNGGNGGSGGPGGNGSPGRSARIQVVSGTAPTLTQGGAPIALNVGVDDAGRNDPAPFPLSAQPVIYVADVACTNADVTFSTADGAPHSWTFGAGANPPNSNTSPQNVRYSTRGRKQITYDGQTYTDFWNIILEERAPTISASPREVCAGGSVSFLADLSGAGYEWQIASDAGFTNIIATSNERNWSYTFTTGGTYHVRHRRYTDCCGWSPWTSLTVTIHPRPNITITPAEPRICRGDQITLRAEVDVPNALITWAPAEGLNTTTGSTVIAAPLATTTYTITAVAPPANCLAARTVVVQVVPPPNGTFNITPASCGPNGSVTFTPTEGEPIVSAVWNTTPPQQGFTATNLEPGGYELTLTNAQGCTRTLSVIVPVAPGALDAWVDNLVSPCQGQNNGRVTIGVQGGTPPYTYSWSHDPNLTGNTATGLAPGNYTVIVRDNAGCTRTVSFTVEPSEPLILNVVEVQNQRCGGICDGRIRVRAQGGARPRHYTYTWRSSTYPNFSFTGANADGETVANLCPGQYQITVQDASGCTATQTVEIAPAFTYSLSSTDAICANAPQGSASVTVQNASPELTWQWTGPSGYTSAPNATSLTNLLPGRYYITFNLPGCPPLRDSVEVGYRSSVEARIVPAQAGGCVPLSVEWRGEASGTGPFTYQWDLGDGTTATTSTVTHLYSNPGTYTVRLIVRNADGCADTATATAEAATRPIPGYQIQPDPTQQDYPIGTLFTLTSTSTNAPRIIWEIPGYGRHEGPTWEVRFNQEGEYCFTLYAQNGSCIDSLRGCLRVEDPFIYVPNAFSPNGDGINDFFEIKVFGLKDGRVRIYSRWGELVFDNQGDMTRHWDGTYRGTPAPEDAYTVVIEGKLPPYDKPIRRTGTVTLIR
ncbi:MAG: PKD domain-containing protein [Bacteroidia bacterium]